MVSLESRLMADDAKTTVCYYYHDVGDYHHVAKDDEHQHKLVHTLGTLDFIAIVLWAVKQYVTVNNPPQHQAVDIQHLEEFKHLKALGRRPEHPDFS